MDAALRIGIAGADEHRLGAELQALPLQLQLLTFRGLYEDTGAIVAQRPDLLFVCTAANVDGSGVTDLIGAARLLRSLLPQMAIVVLAPAEQEVRWHGLERTGARLLPTPFRTRELASVVAGVLRAAERPRDEVFLDLARGFADEINNPLLFLMGHLQLLAAQLEPGQQDLHGQLDSALAGASRIQATVDRLRLLSHAAAGLRHADAVDLLALLDAARREHAAGLPPARTEPSQGPFVLHGDAELLRPAVALLCEIAAEFAAAGNQVWFELTLLNRAVRLRLLLSGAGLDEWRLSRTFEPYYLSRLLRGSSRGLGLFLVQTVVQSHGGLATAQRQPGGGIAIDLLLPTA